MGRRSLRAPLLAAGLLLVLVGAADAQSKPMHELMPWSASTPRPPSRRYICPLLLSLPR